MDLPAETVISEYSPGQLEVVFAPSGDAMRAADEAVQWKATGAWCRGQARSRRDVHGQAVQRTRGSGLHIMRASMTKPVEISLPPKIRAARR